MSSRGHHYDVVVIGAGLSGLLAAAHLAEEGARVSVVAKGGGYLHFTSGCVDVLGNNRAGTTIPSPASVLPAFVRDHPQHPYARAGISALESGLELFCRVMASWNYPFEGTTAGTLTLPTAAGSTRTTCLVPISMRDAALEHSSPMLIAGFRTYRDFYPPYLAANLRLHVDFPVHDVYIDLDRFRCRRHFLSLDIARALDDQVVREDVARALHGNLHGAERVGFPAVLGLEKPREAVAHLSGLIGLPVFEIPTLPPSVPGIRIFTAFRRWLLQRGVRVEVGFWVKGRIEAGRAVEIQVESAGHVTRYTADAYILATGGTGGGGIKAYPDGRLEETVFNLPVEGAKDRRTWFNSDFLGPDPQPISLAGVGVNENLQPSQEGRIVDNVFVTASDLPFWDPTREKSGEGVALSTGWRAGDEALRTIEPAIGRRGSTVATS